MNRTARRFRKAPAAVLAALVTACAGVIPALGQHELAAAAPVVLGRKQASKLLLSQTKPEYPPLARVNYIQGQVRMQVTVARNGHVSDAHVLRGHPFLAASALRAIRRWVYRPFVTEAGPAPFETDVAVNFALRIKDVEHMPPNPEQDMGREVQPPQVVVGSSSRQRLPTGVKVRLRLLVGEDGKVMDATPLDGAPAQVQEAEGEIQGWKFRPARWGNMTVPWYVEVTVPVKRSPADQAGPAHSELPPRSLENR